MNGQLLERSCATRNASRSEKKAKSAATHPRITVHLNQDGSVEAGGTSLSHGRVRSLPKRQRKKTTVAIKLRRRIETQRLRIVRRRHTPTIDESQKAARALC
jgi:hypothetical protein